MNTQHAYTLQSTLTGRYIGELFTKQHNKMFCSTDKQGAYSWPTLKHVHEMRALIQCCIVVRVLQQEGE